MASIAPIRRSVIGGVDTHEDLHVAAVIDQLALFPLGVYFLTACLLITVAPSRPVVRAT